MARCLLCDCVMDLTLINLLIQKQKLCSHCLNNFEIIKANIKVDDIQVHILYSYNDFFREILYQYKVNYDYALKDCFLNTHINELKRKYRGFVLIPAPSYYEADEKRGFNHVEEIFKNLNMRIIKCFKKTKDFKQTEQSYEGRKDIQKCIKIDKSMLKGANKLLLVDDVATSFSTIKSMIRLLPPDKQIKVLIIASNCLKRSNDLQ